jgi:hypothetical protein
MQIRLSEDQARMLKQLAQDEGVSMAELIRRSIDRYIQGEQLLWDERRRKAMSVVGKYASGKQDVSTNHDRYLAEIYGDHDA